MSKRDIVFTLRFKNQAGAVIRKFGTQLKGLGTKANKASKGLKKLGDQFKRLADKAARAGNRIRNAGAMIREAGTQMTFAIGAPLAAAIGFTIKKFADLELAMAGVQKTVGGTDETIEKLKDEFIDMSNKMPTAATELARIGQVAGQLGIEAQNIGTFTDTIAKMAAATDLSTESAAFSLARISNIMGTPQSAAENLASAMVDLGNNFAATEPEIAAFALRIAGAGRVVGLSEGDVLGFSAALASVGVRAQAGGTAISKAFVKIANEVSKGGARVAQFAEIAGMSTEEFARLFKEDAAGALQQFILGLGNASEAGVNVFQVLEDLGLQEIRTRDAMLRLSLSGDLLASAIDRGNVSFKEGTALNKEYAIFLDTTSSRLKILWQQFENAAAIIGKAFEPVITGVLKSLSGFALRMQEWGRALKEMDPALKRTIALVSGFVIALGPALIILGSLTQLFGFAALGVVKFGVAMKGAMVFFLTNPLGLFILAIGTVITLLVKFRNSLITVGDDTARLQDYLVAIWEVIYEKIAAVATGIVEVFQWAANTVAPMFGAPADQMASDLMTSFDVFRSIGNAIIQLFQVVGLTIGVYMSAAFSWMADEMELFINSLKTSASVIAKLVTGDWAGAWETAVAPLKVNPMDNMKMHVKDGLADIKTILEGDPLGEAFKGLGERAGKRYQEHLAKGFSAGDAMAKTMKETLTAAEDDAGNTTPPPGDTFGKLFAKGFRTAFDGYLSTAKDIAKQTEDAFTKAFQGMEDGLMEFLETGKFNFKEFATSIIADFARIGVKSLLADAMGGLDKQAPAKEGLLSGLGGMFGALGGALGFGGETAAGEAIDPAVAATKEQTAVQEGLFSTLGGSLKEGLGGLGSLFTTGLDSLGGMLGGLFSSIGGLFGGGGGGTTDTLGAVMGVVSAFAAEGGVSQNLSKRGMVPAGMFQNARHFAAGGVTSGTDRIPAMLSRNEAVIPLSRNRAVPIEGNMGGATTVNINVQANDVESFKQSQSQMLARFGTAVIRARRKTQ